MPCCRGSAAGVQKHCAKVLYVGSYEHCFLPPFRPNGTKMLNKKPESNPLRHPAQNAPQKQDLHQRKKLPGPLKSRHKNWQCVHRAYYSL